MPFHIEVCITKHVKLENVAKTLIDQPQEQESGILIVQNKFKGMELESQLGPQSRQIHSSIQTWGREPKGYSHPHTGPQRILMGNHKLEQCQSQVKIASPIMSEATIVETRKQHVGIRVPQLLNVGITTTKWKRLLHLT